MEFAERYRHYAATVLREHQAVFDAQDMEELLNFIHAVMEAGRVFVVGAGRGFVSCSGRIRKDRAY